MSRVELQNQVRKLHTASAEMAFREMQMLGALV